MYYTVAIGHIAKVEDDLQLCAFFFFFFFFFFILQVQQAFS